MAAEFLEQMGAQMRGRREALGLSRSEVARRMPGKVSENQVYRWEKGLHQPNPDTLQALADVLECSVATLMSSPPVKERTPEPFSALSQLDRIEHKLDLLIALAEQEVGDQVLRAVEQDMRQADRKAS